MLFHLMGALGLFLLGMWLMTEGLKLAGGKALQVLLAKCTANRLRGLAAGTLITALVQSSSAVTVAVLGFVNAGIMNFRQSLWVVYGSNLGSTFTAWIVMLFGFSFKIDALTFPLLGVGAFMRLFAPNERARALGMALAGFALLFMGIDALRDYFADYSHQLDLQALLSGSGWPVLWAVVIGFVLTLFTQSSSAAIAIILTAVASGVADLDSAMGAVIGANIGTTSTALIASIGATASAKRLALAHIIFKLLAATVCLLILPVFSTLVGWVAPDVQHAQAATLILAIFHTAFNLLGVGLMWLLHDRLVGWLLQRFEDAPDLGGKLVHLDANIATVPDLALRATQMELGEIARQIAYLPLPGQQAQTLDERRLQLLQQRLRRVKNMIELTLKPELTQQQGRLLSTCLAVAHYLSTAGDYYARAWQACGDLLGQQSVLPQALYQWLYWVGAYAKGLPDQTEAQAQQLREIYRETKAGLLTAAVSDHLSLAAVDLSLQAASFTRRFVEQLEQAQAGINQDLSDLREAPAVVDLPSAGD